MHLLLIHQNFPGQFRELAPAWLAAGHRITAVGCQEQPPEGAAWQGLRYIHYAFEEQPTALQRGQAVARVCQFVLEQAPPPDLALVHSGWGEALQLRAALGRTPLVIYPELWGTPAALGLGVDANLEQHLPQGPHALEHWLERQNLLADLSLQQADAAVIPSTSQLSSFPPELRSKLQLIAEGVDLERLQPNPTSWLDLDGSTRIRAGDAVVTVVSRTLEPLRGLRAVLQAWPAVAARHPEARLILVGAEHGHGYGREQPQGSSHLCDALEALPQSVDQDRIHMPGHLPYPDLIRLLQCSACHLALSYPYTLSWSWLEAMACGAPVITNHTSPLAAELHHDHNGLVVKLNQPETLSSAILGLLNNPSRAAQIGAAGRALVKQRFNLQTALHAYEALFHDLLASR